MKINYDLKLQETLKTIGNQKPTLLLHVCCAPCSCNVLEELLPYFHITIYYSNSNIYPDQEYHRRLDELKRFINKHHSIQVIEQDYQPEKHLLLLEPYKELKEGSMRCYTCYKKRMFDTFHYALDHHFDYWTTVLSVSPHKNSQWINEIGASFDQSQTKFLFSDFKKRQGYLKSTTLAKKYQLYRQDYCGCVYSYQEMLERKNK